ncbi:glutamate--cysteine ligase [Streptomyces sp. NPDC060194]|uniref:glutamate--cysteine ligase n=1 Tax=Streptomyces sp. NPDC060194 TaxID=3347069 RepID=UPI003659C7E8
MRTVGVEEELLLVSKETGEPLAMSAAVLAGTSDDSVFEEELQLQQLEFGTRPQSTMDEIEAEIRRWRGEAARRAGRVGATVAALGTSPLPVSPSLSPGERYAWMAEEYGLTANEQLTCGCHVHVSVESDEEGVAVLDRIRPWLAPLLAMTANSPFWQAQDTAYASYRSRVWGRWPSAGPVAPFGSAEGYHATVRSMIATGVLRDEGMIYFDARLSRSYPTVEIRVGDVCLEPEDTVLLAALVRGLVETSAAAWRAGEPVPEASVGLLRLAAWRAGRSGLDSQLVDPRTWSPAPAAVVLRALVDHVSDALTEYGDLDMVRERLEALLARGTGARTQRALFEKSGGDLRALVAECARITAPGPVGIG